MPYQPPSTTITFRTSRETAAKLETLAAATGFTRSMLVAMLLHAAVSDPTITDRIRALGGHP